MAGSKFAYVRNFELPDPLLPETFMVLRIDGHAFHRLVMLTPGECVLIWPGCPRSTTSRSQTMNAPCN